MISLEETPLIFEVRTRLDDKDILAFSKLYARRNNVRYTNKFVSFFTKFMGFFAVLLCVGSVSFSILMFVLFRSISTLSIIMTFVNFALGLFLIRFDTKTVIYKNLLDKYTGNRAIFTYEFTLEMFTESRTYAYNSYDYYLIDEILEDSLRFFIFIDNDTWIILKKEDFLFGEPEKFIKFINNRKSMGNKKIK